MNTKDKSNNQEVLTDENYDYVLVLKPDEEYRLAVQALPQITDFQEYSKTLNNANNENPPSPINNNKHLPKTISNYRLISEIEFDNRLNTLRKQKQSISTEIRRSTIGFLDKYSVTNENAMSNFVLLMSQGVYLTCHKAYKESNIIRLHTTNCCKDILWSYTNSDNPEEADKKKESEDAATAAAAAADIETGQTAADRAIAIKKKTEQNKPSTIYTFLNILTQSFGLSNTGSFSESNILRIHPAKYEDPTAIGMYGTHNLRNSLDSYNEDYSFSIVLQQPGRREQYYTIDVECESFELYIVLLRGFMIMYDRARHERMRENANLIESSLFHSYDCDYHIWKNSPPTSDPVQSLFQPRGHKCKYDPLASMFTQPTSPPPPATVPTSEGEQPDNQGATSSELPLHSHMLPQVYSVNDIPPAQFLGWKAAGTQIWARLKMAGCDVRCEFSYDLQQVCLQHCYILMCVHIYYWFIYHRIVYAL